MCALRKDATAWRLSFVFIFSQGSSCLATLGLMDEIPVGLAGSIYRSLIYFTELVEGDSNFGSWRIDLSAGGTHTVQDTPSQVDPLAA